MAILSFDGRVNIATRIVQEQYPDAKLYEADGVSTTGPTDDAAGIDKMRVVFQNSDNTTVMITEEKYGEFGEPKLFKSPFLGDVVIEWPIKMDLTQAIELKNRAGYKGEFTTVTLRNPLGPRRTNPFFIFGSDQRAFVFVDVVTGEVHSGE